MDDVVTFSELHLFEKAVERAYVSVPHGILYTVRLRAATWREAARLVLLNGLDEDRFRSLLQANSPYAHIVTDLLGQGELPTQLVWVLLTRALSSGDSLAQALAAYVQRNPAVPQRLDHQVRVTIHRNRVERRFVAELVPLSPGEPELQIIVQ